jgi:hypothetical protein
MSDPLAFLSPANARAEGRFGPLAKSSMERRLRDRGAEFEERDGRLVCVRVPGEDAHALGVRDVTHLYAVQEGESDADVDAPEGGFALRVPTGHTFVARPAGTAPVAAEGFLDLTGGYAALEIAGPAALTAIRRLTELDPDELPAVGPVAHVRSFVFRPGDERFVLFFPQEYGHYLWEVAVDTVEPLGGGPKA